MKLPQPKYEYWVQIKDHIDLHPHTRMFLQEHAKVPLESISVQETNEFLARSWNRANWAGEAWTDGRQPA